MPSRNKGLTTGSYNIQSGIRLSKTNKEEFKKEHLRSKGLARELRRKEKALAETAALQVLRKKAHAIESRR